MNRRELTNRLAKKLGIPYVTAYKYISAFEETLGDALSQDTPIVLVGFGAFSPWHQTERPARNPKNGVPCTIIPRVSVKFKPGKFLLEKLNPQNEEI